MDLIINPRGVVRTIYGEKMNLAAIGRMTIRRASHVEPTVAGDWTVDLSPVGGPTLGPFRQRSAALAAEETWLTERLGSLP